MTNCYRWMDSLGSQPNVHLTKWNKRERKKEIEELGYGAKAPEYEALNTDIATLEKQLKGNADASSVFAKLEDKLSGFLKRQSQQERR